MDEINIANQTMDVLACLKRNGYITEDMAMAECGVKRLSARIFDLREAGNDITTVLKSGKSRYGRPSRYLDRYVLNKAVQ